MAQRDCIKILVLTVVKMNKVKNMSKIKLCIKTLFLILALSQLSFAQASKNSGAKAQSAKKDLCFEFDVRPFQRQLLNSEDIKFLTLYPSIFNMTDKRSSRLYFVDHGVRHNEDAYNIVDCQMSASYINCTGQEDTADFGIYVDKDKAQLHFRFMTLSDLDEDLRELKPVGKKSITIPGKIFPCPKDSPEVDLY